MKKVSRRGFLAGATVGAVGVGAAHQAVGQAGFIDLGTITFDENGNMVIGGAPSEPISPSVDPNPPSTPNPPVTPSAIRVRRSIYALDPNGAEVNSLRRGISAMMRRPLNDPLSWRFQGAVHDFRGSPPAGLPQEMFATWSTCEHANLFFLGWHRMYLHFFERILRQESGDPNLTLPYWDYSIPGQGALPVAFRSPATASNPLYRAERDTQRVNVNGGQALPFNVTDSFAALQRTSFLNGGFAQAVESVPHNVVHVAIGGRFGLMTDPATAALDPIFWLHHCNIDRLWSRWIGLGGGRANPTNDFNFMNRPYSFYDADGTRVTMTGREVLDTASQLSYRYDDDPVGGGFAPAPILVADAGGGFELGEAPLASSAGALRLDGRSVSVPVGSAIEAGGPEIFVTDLTAPDARPVLLNLEGIAFERAPGIWYDIYINLPRGAAPDPRGPYYAGVFAPFAQNRSSEPVTFDITGVLNRQVEAGLFKGGEIDVQFITDEAGGIETGEDAPPVTIEQITITRP